VPQRFTGLLSPPDTHWFAVFKRAYRARWNNWFAQAAHTFTVAGNLRSPSYGTVLHWLSEIWAEFDPQLIRNSFEECGIVSSDFEDPLHSSLAAVLDGVDVREYLEDVLEEDLAREDDGDSISSHDPESGSDTDLEYETESESETSEDETSEGEDSDDSDETADLADRLNNSTIVDESDDGDDQPVDRGEASTFYRRRPNRQLSQMKPDFA
jgi:hypothetical protein